MRIYSPPQKKAISHFFLVPAILLFLLVICPLPALAQAGGSVDTLRQIGKTFAEIAEKASPAVVGLEVEKSTVPNRPNVQQWPFGQPFRRHFGEPYYQEHRDLPYFIPPDQIRPPLPNPSSGQRSHGCGFIVSKYGYLLTNEHVVRDARRVKVRLADRRDLEAKIVGTDPETDIAVLKIAADGLPFLEMDDSDAVGTGDWVVAVSSPSGPGHPFTAGMVTAKGRSGLGLADYEDFIQTDAAIALGQGGGPLLNLDGKVVGINTAIIDRSPGARLSLAIPVNMAKFVYEQLVEHGAVERGFLGVSIQDVDRDMAEALGLKDAGGVAVSQVVEDSGAEKAGIKPHDVIISLNGEPLKSASQLRNRIALLRPRTQVEVVVLRGGDQESFTVTLGARSTVVRRAPDSSGEVKGVGFSVQDLTTDLAEHLGYKGETGVVVTEVEAGSEAARKGITSGVLILEVNRKPVRSTRDFNREIQQGRKYGSVLLLIKDQRRTRFVTLRLK